MHPIFDGTGRQQWVLLPNSGMLGVDVTNQPIDIVNKGRAKEGPACPKYVQAKVGCDPSSPVLSSASGVDTKWIFTPTGNPNGRFQFYISMSVSAAATSRRAAEMTAIVLKISVPLTHYRLERQAVAPSAASARLSPTVSPILLS